jgi:hypothetical protein
MPNDSELNVAENFYLIGEFELASEAYSGQLDSVSVNPKILVNKSISEFKHGQYGASLVDLYRAKKLIPRDKKLNMNIELVQEELNLNQPNLSFLNYLTVNELLIILAITNLFFVLRWRLTKSRIMRFFVSAVFVIVLMLSAYTYVNQELIDYAVVQSSSSKVYSGNNDSFSEIGELLEGQVIKVKSKNHDWSQISYNQQLGWVKEENLAYF